VKVSSVDTKVPSHQRCPHCDAPHNYIYYNDGKRRTQLKCKVCQSTFKLRKNLRKTKAKYWCPHCGYALYAWKKSLVVTIYKCGNDHCPHRIRRLKKLNIGEEIIRQTAPNHFKINYQYKEYHLTPKQKQHSAPAKSRVELFRIHRSDNILGLILTFYISYALSARKTALILRQVFNITVSHQTVLNYAQAAAYYVHQFNLKNKGPIDDIAVGDETYIKVDTKYNYVWFMLCPEKLSITAYHLADNRGTLPAVAAISEAIKTARADQKLTLITDGNPAYTEALHYINKTTRSHNPIEHIKVIGLQNEDEVSEEFRPFKQAIERLNRTYKHHVRPANGFKSFDGAMAVTALFVAHYNFLRRHMTLNYKTPIHIEQLEGITTIQAKWVRLIDMMC